MGSLCVLLLALSTLANAKSFWLIEAGRLSRVDAGAGAKISATLDASVRDVAPIGNGGAWVLTDSALVLVDDALVAQVSVPVAPDIMPMVGPIAADREGGAWLGVGASLVNFDRSGSRVRQWTIDSPALAIGVAGPDAVFVATASSLLRLDSNGTTVARIDLVHLPGSGVIEMLMDPGAGYLWLVRAGAVIQFDALMGLATRTTMILPGLDAVGIDAESGTLTLVVGGEIRHYDRNAAPVLNGTFASEALVDIAGIEADLRKRLLWFGDRTGLGTIDLTDGAVLRLPGGRPVDAFTSDPARVESRLGADVAGNAETDASTQVSLRLQTYCNGLPCLPSASYRNALQLRATRDEVRCQRPLQYQRQPR